MTATTLDTLTSFTVRAKFSRYEACYRAYPRGRREPVVTLLRQANQDSLRPFRILVGPGFTELAGFAAGLTVYDKDRQKIGEMRSQSRFFRDNFWELSRPVQSTLVGEYAGPLSPVRIFPLIRDTAFMPNWFAFKIRFRADDSAGFTVRRRLGPTGRFAVKVHDPAIDRRLILGTVLQLSEEISLDVRRVLFNLMENPFRPSEWNLRKAREVYWD